MPDAVAGATPEEGGGEARMTEIVGLTFPLFALIVLGYAVTKAGAFSQDDLRLFGRYAIEIAIPALIFGAVTRAPLGETIRPVYLAAFTQKEVMATLNTLGDRTGIQGVLPF